MKLRESLPRETIIAGDNALIGIWAARYFPIYHPRTYLFPMGYGTLGFAVPAAIGARIAKPDRPVVALVGDGGFLFSAQELAAAVQNHLDLTVIIVNDNRYGSVHYNQRKKFDRVIASELENPDFELFARSFGCNYSFIDEPLALGELVERKIHQKGVNIIEVDGSFMNWY
ncbi:MAG TPA: thiamine pyrophosphate-dependent enzyme [Bacillales bacterium]